MVLRYARSGYRKGRRLYRWTRKNPKQAMAMAKSALSGVKFLKSIVNSERFHKDSTIGLGSAQNATHHLTSITQGDYISSRTGNSILVKSLAIQGHMYINSSQTTNSRIMLALVQDKQQISDTNPTAADIFSSDSDPHTLLNAGTLGRFKILWRKQYTLDSNTAGNNARSIRIYNKLHFHARYNGTGAQDIQKNGLYLVMITSESTLYPTISLNTRLSYHDN